MVLERLLLKLFKVREIPHPDGCIYLRRFFITPRWFPWINVFVHKLYTPDPDRAMRDHPWDFWTFPLSGYFERRDDSYMARIVYSRRWHFRPAEYMHRIVLLGKTPTWTIMVTRKARREWGFWVESPVQNVHDGIEYRWVHWRDYLNLPDEPQSWEDVVQ